MSKFNSNAFCSPHPARRLRRRKGGGGWGVWHEGGEWEGARMGESVGRRREGGRGEEECSEEECSEESQSGLLESK